MQLRAQGATEYLVLLAVVLIVALVSVALLGFFPGMASDAQLTQSQTYWRSASPIAIVEATAGPLDAGVWAYPYLRVKNSGAYPIRITGLVGADGGKGTLFTAWTGAGCSPVSSGGNFNISDYFYLGPGEEAYFGTAGVPCVRYFGYTSGPSGGSGVGGATSICSYNTTNPGTLVLPSFGFEYIEYLDNNQQITKKEIGKALIIKCKPSP